MGTFCVQHLVAAHSSAPPQYPPPSAFGSGALSGTTAPCLCQRGRVSLLQPRGSRCGQPFSGLALTGHFAQWQLGSTPGTRGSCEGALRDPGACVLEGLLLYLGPCCLGPGPLAVMGLDVRFTSMCVCSSHVLRDVSFHMVGVLTFKCLY